jgi:xanthine dehydrogenase YagS FAD-binding subunit
MDRFEYVNATSVAEALAQIGEGRILKAGGIDLLDRMKEGLSSPKRIVNLRTIGALEGITIGDAGVTIGPLTTLAAVASHKDLRNRYGAIADAALMAATPQIRNMATAGGNLLQRPRCWYFRNGDTNCLRKGGDGCLAQSGANRYHAIFGNDVCGMVHPSALAVPLTAFDAVVELTSAKATRKTPVATFYLTPDVDPTREADLKPDEILTAIRVPQLRPGTRSAYLKQKERESADWPLADVAVVLEMPNGVVQRAAIVLGAVAAKPWRSTAAEAELKGKRINEDVARRAAAAAVRGAKPLAGNAYKVAVVETIVRRAILEAAS